MKKGWKWVIGILVVLYLFGRISGGGSSRSSGTRSAQSVQQEQTAPAQQVQQERQIPQKEPAAEPVQQEREEARNRWDGIRRADSLDSSPRTTSGSR